MSDLLGSILGTMEKPPSTSSDKLAKKQQEEYEKIQQKEKAKLHAFRLKTQEQISTFVKDPSHKKMTFPFMPNVYRAIVHDISEVVGLLTHTFGQEDVDRHIVLWKKEFPPSEGELRALKEGREYNKAIDDVKKSQDTTCQEDLKPVTRPKPSTAANNSHKYTEKYLSITREAEKRAASMPITGKHCYGMVPSDNKRDHRTIEEVLAENKARKRLKTNETQPSQNSAQSS